MNSLEATGRVLLKLLLYGGLGRETARMLMSFLAWLITSVHAPISSDLSDLPQRSIKSYWPSNQHQTAQASKSRGKCGGKIGGSSWSKWSYLLYVWFNYNCIFCLMYTCTCAAILFWL